MAQQDPFLEAEGVDPSQVLRRDGLRGQLEFLLDLIGHQHVALGVKRAKGPGDFSYQVELLGRLWSGHDLERRGRLAG